MRFVNTSPNRWINIVMSTTPAHGLSLTRKQGGDRRQHLSYPSIGLFGRYCRLPLTYIYGSSSILLFFFVKLNAPFTTIHKFEPNIYEKLVIWIMWLHGFRRRVLQYQSYSLLSRYGGHGILGGQLTSNASKKCPFSAGKRLETC